MIIQTEEKSEIHRNAALKRTKAIRIRNTATDPDQHVNREP